MRKFILFLIIGLLLAFPVALVYAAPPPNGPPGLEQAITAKNRHANALLAVPGVAGVAVGLSEDGKAVVVIFTKKSGVRGLPASLEGISTLVRISGEFVASAPPEGKGPKNRSPKVTITNPADGAVYNSGDSIDFSGTANDKEDGDLSDNLSWESDDVHIFDGPSFSLVLEDGTHIITASVTDPGGKTGSTSLTITIGQGPAPPSDWWWNRPVPIGVSTGYPDITAGTIGARVTDGSKVYALSNNHVYANENQASIGDNVLQPGIYDGGRNPIDAIGTLSAFKSIKFKRRANNVIDAAIALSNVESLGNTTPGDGYGTPKSATEVAYIGMLVMKYGRTTGFTHGQVYAIDATVNVRYDSGWARFVHQIVITPGAFSDSGDSGSLIVVDSAGNTEDRKPVGLLFAGSSSYTIANPIDEVLSYFSVTIDGE
ncbi:Ig-like domain-containing protein [Chloroflexota bacterium]